VKIYQVNLKILYISCILSGIREVYLSTVKEKDISNREGLCQIPRAHLWWGVSVINNVSLLYPGPIFDGGFP
jgi:hypothetical protein